MDSYTFHARTVPMFAMLIASIPAFAAWCTVDNVVQILALTLALAILLAHICNDFAANAGAKIQDKLWRSWGGPPTTSRLRAKGVGSPHLRSMFRSAVEKHIGVALPSEDDEKADPTTTELFYEAVVLTLITERRDRSRYPLIFKENVRYGFARNCYGLRYLGLALAATSVLSSTISIAVSGSRIGIVSLVSGCILSIFWWGAFSTNWVALQADRYAMRLLESFISVIDLPRLRHYPEIANPMQTAHRRWLRLASLVILAIVAVSITTHFAYRTPKATNVQPVKDTFGAKWVRRAGHIKSHTVIVFVHGIGGGETTTWTNANGTYWPSLLAEERVPEFASCDIIALGYQSGLLANPTSIGEKADYIRLQLDLEGCLDYRNIVFVCHSMGGLVVRSYIIKWNRSRELLSKVRALVFYGVPTNGSQLADAFKAFARGAVQMSEADEFLRDQTRSWLALFDKGRQFKTFVGYEKLPVFPLGRVIVGEASAVALADRVDAVVKDHFDIVKPADHADMSHRLLRQALRESPLKDGRDPSKDAMESGTSTPDEDWRPLNQSEVAKLRDLLGREVVKIVVYWGNDVAARGFFRSLKMVEEGSNTSVVFGIGQGTPGRITIFSAPSNESAIKLSRALSDFGYFVVNEDGAGQEIEIYLGGRK